MRRGVTLIELLVTLSVIGIVAGVATLTISKPPVRDDVAARVFAARRYAVNAGHDTTIIVEDSIEVTAWPDGSIVTDTALRVDRLTGVVHVAR